MPIEYHENKPPTYICEDCGLNYTHFDNHMLIIEEHIWLSIANKESVLCDECIKKRLGRQISFDDLALNDYGAITPINNWYIKKCMNYINNKL